MSFRIIETPSWTVQSNRDPKEGKITRSLTRQFTLDASDTNETQFTALQALRNENVFEGASYPGSIFYFCNSIQITQVSPISYDATANYESPPFKEDENPNADPTLEPTKVSYASSTTEIETGYDADGDAIATVTGEMILGVTRRVSDTVITIKKNYAAFNRSAIDDFMDRVNDSTFLGYAAGRVLVSSITSDEVVQDGYTYWQVTVQLIARKPLAEGVTDEKTWWSRQRHEGVYTKKVGGGTTRCVDANKEPITSPAPLDAAGYQQSEDEDPHFLYFEHYKPVSFSGMNLGVS